LDEGQRVDGLGEPLRLQLHGAVQSPDGVLDGLLPDPVFVDRGALTESHERGAQLVLVGALTLAVSLVGEPDLLIFDEPSSGLDPDGVALLREIIREETGRGATVFFSSHILEEVEKVCDRVGILDDGELVALDTIENLRGELETGATVTATLDSSPGDIDAGGISGVRNVAVDGRVVSAEVTEPAAKMRVLRRLDERATVEDIGIEEASLEALFSEYTRAGGDGAATDDAGSADQSTGGETPQSPAATPGGESA